MSAQFIDIYEIGTDAPVSVTSNEKPKKDPLNLTLVLKNDRITIKTGANLKTYKTFSTKDLIGFNKAITELKQKHPKEDTAILKPRSNFKYEKIIQVIDHTREQVAKIDQVKNDKKEKLFDKIIFDTMD